MEPKPNTKRITNFLLVIQSVGAIFTVIFLAAYLGGMFMTPSTTVLHSEPAFRYPLMVFGAMLLVGILVGVILAVRQNRQ